MGKIRVFFSNSLLLFRKEYSNKMIQDLPDNYTDDEIREQIRNFYSDLEKKHEPKREKIQVLVVDDEERNLSSFKALLRTVSYTHLTLPTKRIV